jgi:hypothetical protein
MTCKLQNGYNAYFTISEFMTFLDFFNNKIRISDYTKDILKIFKNFFNKKDGNIAINSNMAIFYVEDIDDYCISCNYNFGRAEESLTNIYSMQNKDVKEIKDNILEYLKSEEKRKIQYGNINIKDVLLGKCVSAQIIKYIWNTYVNTQILNRRWPIQCENIDKYLLDFDLAPSIGIKSIKNDLIDLYNTLAYRISNMYHFDENLEITSYSDKFLGKSNYKLLIEGYEDILLRFFRNVPFF